MRAAMALVLVWAVKLCATTSAALYPLRGRLWKLQHFSDIAELYTLSDSNLDVWLLSVLHTLVLAVLLSLVVRPQRRFSGLVVAPPYTKVGWKGLLE
jgi:hypothetical protein